MVSNNYAQLLFNAVRETLETMAFAEVVPCSIKIGDEELNHENGLDDFVLGEPQENASPASAGAGADSWGTVSPAVSAPADPAGGSADAGVDAWGTPDAGMSADAGADDAWGTPDAGMPADAAADDAWGTPDAGMPADAAADDAWGTPATELPDSNGDGWGDSVAAAPSGTDPWGDAGMAPGGGEVAGLSIRPKDIDFNELMENQEDWIWSCMRVNSPEINTVWFVVSKELAMELANNMYAGENLDLDSPIIRDLVAELTNVFGGRLMLLLESLGGKFTLTVPEIGVGFPQLPDNTTMETVLCRVLVDGEYPVLASLTFNKT